MLEIGHEQLQRALQELDQALYNHERWHKELTRTLVCRLSSDQRDVANDAHRRCRFGHWYYDSPAELREHPAFAAIGTEHERMHQFAAQLLRSSSVEGSLSPDDYDHFANALDRLRLEIASLRREIEESLYNTDRPRAPRIDSER